MPTNKSKIYNLKDLTALLKDKPESSSYSEILNRIGFGYKEIEHLCFWDPDYYSKINIEKENSFELVLICWEQGQKSPIHNHDYDEAWTCILKGELTEEVYLNSDTNNPHLENTIKLSQKNVSCIKNDSKKTHRLINSFKGRSVSLHLYKK